jgi:hypothetical protein
VVLLLERTLISWSLAMDERGGHEDLCGSDRWNVIPYVHERTELYCSSTSAGASVMHERALKTREPSCVPRVAKPFFIPVVHSPPGPTDTW